jgi:uncharacterized membrane protein YbhN (UPF0104 family)
MQAGEPAAPAMRYLVLGVKVVLSAALIAYAFRNIDLADASAQIHEIAGVAALSTAGVLLLQSGTAAFRLRKVLEVVGARCGFLQALDATFIGAFFSQTLISFVGGDAMRVWRLAWSGVPTRLATTGIALDRTAGLAGSLGLVLLTLPFLLALIQDAAMRSGLLLALAGGIAGFAFVLSIRFMPERFRQNKLIHWTYEFAAVTLSVAQSPMRLASLVALSLIVQLLNVLALFALARGLSIGLTLWHSLLLIPPVLFLSMLPISVAGWGVREGAMIVALALVGVPASSSVALSVCFGLFLIGISLPGALLWMLTRGRTAPGEQRGLDGTRDQ